MVAAVPGVSDKGAAAVEAAFGPRLFTATAEELCEVMVGKKKLGKAGHTLWNAMHTP